MLDVGCGTGISSRLFIARGCTVLGLEPDQRMAEVARRRGVDVESGTIEEWEAGDRQFDLLAAGQAWHWVDPHPGAAKAAAVLRTGGRIGLFWNQARPDSSVRPALEVAYERHAPELGRRSVLMGQRDVGVYESIAESLRQTQAFDDVRSESSATTSPIRPGNGSSWPPRIATTGSWATDQLERLLAELQGEIERAGGRVPVHYEATLVTGLRG